MVDITIADLETKQALLTESLLPMSWRSVCPPLSETWCLIVAATLASVAVCASPIS